MTQTELNRGTNYILKLASIKMYHRGELNQQHPAVKLHNNYIAKGQDLHGLIALDLAQLKPGLSYNDYPINGKQEQLAFDEVVKQISLNPKLRRNN